jgi:hypothetical protein
MANPSLSHPPVAQFCCQQHHPFTTDHGRSQRNRKPTSFPQPTSRPCSRRSWRSAPPDFKDPALLLIITSGDFKPCKNMLLDCQLQSTETTEAGNPKRATAEYDKIDLHNESVGFNCEKILRRVMPESFETWKVKKHLEDCKSTWHSHATSLKNSVSH